MKLTDKTIQMIAMIVNENTVFIDGENCLEMQGVVKLRRLLENEELRLVEPEQWKGYDKVEFKKGQTFWIIREHRKDKDTKQVKTHDYKLPNENVRRMWAHIMSYEDGTKIKYKKLVTDLIFKHKLSVEKEAFNGGKNRAKFYFPYYYYPIKVLEHLNLIHYGGRGTVTIKKR